MSAKTISSYVSSFPKNVSFRLNEINKTVKKLAPEAEEKISYGMPAYKYKGKVLLYFAAHKNHIGLYPYPSTIAAFKKISKKYKTAKGSIQFQNNEKFPLALIKKIIKFRVKDVLSKTPKVCSRGHKFIKSKDFPVCPKCWPGRYIKKIK